MWNVFAVRAQAQACNIDKVSWYASPLCVGHANMETSRVRKCALTVREKELVANVEHRVHFLPQLLHLVLFAAPQNGIGKLQRPLLNLELGTWNRTTSYRRAGAHIQTKHVRTEPNRVTPWVPCEVSYCSLGLPLVLRSGYEWRGNLPPGRVQKISSY
jgi:hypothetical protein